VHTETYKHYSGASANDYGSQSIPNGGRKRWAVMNFREGSPSCFEHYFQKLHRTEMKWIEYSLGVSRTITGLFWIFVKTY
jgi:hypothetical protein